MSTIVLSSNKSINELQLINFNCGHIVSKYEKIEKEILEAQVEQQTQTQTRHMHRYRGRHRHRHSNRSNGSWMHR